MSSWCIARCSSSSGQVGSAYSPKRRVWLLKSLLCSWICLPHVRLILDYRASSVLCTRLYSIVWDSLPVEGLWSLQRKSFCDLWSENFAKWTTSRKIAMMRKAMTRTTLHPFLISPKTKTAMSIAAKSSLSCSNCSPTWNHLSIRSFTVSLLKSRGQIWSCLFNLWTQEILWSLSIDT